MAKKSILVSFSIYHEFVYNRSLQLYSDPCFVCSFLIFLKGSLGSFDERKVFEGCFANGSMFICDFNGCMRVPHFGI